MSWENESGISTLKVAKEDSIEASLRDLWTKVSSELLPLHKEVPWDHMRIEIWGDSGRILLFPASSRESSRIEKLVYQIVFQQLLNQYETLADSDANDELFAKEWLSVTRSWASSLASAASSGGLSGLRLVFWDAEDEVPVLELVT